MTKFKLYIISPDPNDAYRYAGSYLKITSNEVEVLSDEESINKINKYSVAVAIPYLVSNIGFLSKVASSNKNIEFFTAGEASIFGNQLGQIISSTIDECITLRYSLNDIDAFLRRRIDMNFEIPFKFDFRFRIKSSRVELVPKNQPTAAYLYMANPHLV